MSQFTKRGSAAVESATAEKDATTSLHVPFPSGTTLKVRIKSAEDSAEYYAHGIFGKVNTFVPKVPAERNAKGYVTANHSVWDRAADLLYADAKAAKDGGDEKGAEEIRKQAYLLKSKARYLVGFGNLETGEDGFVDLTPKQAKGVFAAINKYAKRLDKIAFELTKSGSSTDTAVTLSPIIDMDEDLTDVERENFAKTGESPFDFAAFEGFLFEADEAEQTKNLVIAGFDIARLGLSIGAAAASSAPATDESAPISDTDAPPVNF
ncbi:hypothetical protein BBD42_15380 [Paenibacillus sp. BIHB 4019]|uniref:Uncharacterized protein n=1 Tax=Paenibacillus sp. BIHB 4019 TaxID=1870819 RepID=A0A1B2DJ21_9BACL|nr:hypothetical protein [Paenibacillus sp. BIHB 4019]ANY67693.1 hypothetical protein BBD42_15380 [Paenibacillus sp. BIHB 4019]